MKIKLVEQEHDNGCGIACVAMVANKEYSEVKSILDSNVLKNKRSRSGLRATQEDIYLLLGELKMNPQKLNVSSLKSIQNTCVVAVNKNEAGQYHWVVAFKIKDEVCILDPWYGELLKLDHRRYKPIKSGKAVELPNHKPSVICLS